MDTENIAAAASLAFLPSCVCAAPVADATLRSQLQDGLCLETTFICARCELRAVHRDSVRLLSHLLRTHCHAHMYIVLSSGAGAGSGPDGVGQGARIPHSAAAAANDVRGLHERLQWAQVPEEDAGASYLLASLLLAVRLILVHHKRCTGSCVLSGPCKCALDWVGASSLCIRCAQLLACTCAEKFSATAQVRCEYAC